MAEVYAQEVIKEKYQRIFEEFPKIKITPTKPVLITELYSEYCFLIELNTGEFLDFGFLNLNVPPKVYSSAKEFKENIGSYPKEYPRLSIQEELEFRKICNWVNTIYSNVYVKEIYMIEW